jgi:hypothetical protein
MKPSEMKLSAVLLAFAAMLYQGCSMDESADPATVAGAREVSSNPPQAPVCVRTVDACLHYANDATTTHHLLVYISGYQEHLDDNKSFQWEEASGECGFFEIDFPDKAACEAARGSSAYPLCEEKPGFLVETDGKADEECEGDYYSGSHNYYASYRTYSVATNIGCMVVGGGRYGSISYVKLIAETECRYKRSKHIAGLSCESVPGNCYKIKKDYSKGLNFQYSFAPWS